MRGDLLIVWDAFTDLSGTREHNRGFSQPIKFTEMEAWFRLNRVNDKDDKEVFARFIRTMDSVWLELSYRKTEAAMKQKK